MYNFTQSLVNVQPAEILSKAVPHVHQNSHAEPALLTYTY